jgi:hypothetical protein
MCHNDTDQQYTRHNNRRLQIMKKRIMHLTLLVALLASLVILPLQQTGQVQAQGEVPNTYPPYRAHYFAETGHSAVNWFLETWQKTPNALFVLGYPISEPFIEESFTNPGEYYRVQYFERAVLEEHAENFGKEGNNYYVLGRLMGRLAAQGREGEPAFQMVENPGDGTWFAETGHTLRNEPAPFRTFFAQNGGLATFGYPISEQFEEVNQADGQTYWVQYFERQRMEWHPEIEDPQYQILLGLLGSEYRDMHHASNDAFDYRPARQSLPQPFIYGYNATLYSDGEAWQDRKRALQLAKNSGVNWIRQQIAWKDLQDASGEIYWGELDDIVQDSHAAGVNLLLSVVQAPAWATPNGSHGLPSREHFSTFANFMGQMAARYRGRVQAYEIWNEQNRACENGGDCSTAGGIGGQVASADYYVRMLAATYDAIKANDPYAIVVSGGPTSTETNHPDIAMSDVTYIREMLSHPNFRADAVGVHPGGQNNPPDTMWPDNPGPQPWQNSREFYFRRVEDIRQAMVDAGRGDLQMWITEFGWATANTTPGYEYGNEISFETQADWIVRAFEKGRVEYAPWVGAMFLWNLNFAVSWQGAHGDPTHEQASFGVLNPDWSPRPAWHAIQAMKKE